MSTEAPERRPGELGARELARWAWRQLTSMRTALILLLLLALAAVPGSLIPQAGVDALEVTQWKDDHPDLARIYERLGLFSVYSTPWFAAIYILLMVSLVGCIIPRTLAYARALRAVPPQTPRNLGRLPDHREFSVEADPDVVLERARAHFRKGRYRLRSVDDTAPGSVSAEKGYLREFGNLVFHVSLIVVLVGVAWGSLFGYQGGVLLVRGQTFSNTIVAYDDFAPGNLFGADDLDTFQFTVDDFDATFLTKGSGAGTARGFRAPITYREGLDGPEQTYDLRVNHPLQIDDTEVFLIGHGYAPVVTIRDGEGNIAYSGPTIFLPQDQSFLSFGVIKAPSARPGQIGLEGLFYPTFALNDDGDPVTIWPDALDPLISMTVWTGDLGLDDGVPQSVYLLDTGDATPVEDAEGKQVRLDLSIGDTEQLPDGLGSVTFEGVEPWVRVQISQTPGKRVALAGVVLALIGLLCSLFVRPRRVWVRAASGPGGTMVEVGVLDRSGGADLTEVLDDIAAALRGQQDRHDHDRGHRSANEGTTT